jgi:two-component system chemotaxis response regulator CheB
LKAEENIIERWHNTDILLVGGSAGSFKNIFHLIKILRPDINKTVIIIIHRKRNFLSDIETLFAENCSLAVREISDKDKINKNAVYIAPANYHTLIEKGDYFSLDVSEPVWYSKPSIDITFESAAEQYGDRCTAILFSGANPDGAGGMLKLKLAGSLTIVQNPEEAEMSEMPAAAININGTDYVLKAEEIFELLTK